MIIDTEPYKNRKGEPRVRPILDPDFFDSDGLGFCIGCGSEIYGVEPDAQKYPCESCGESLVYGLEELLIMDIARLGEGS